MRIAFFVALLAALTACGTTNGSGNTTDSGKNSGPTSTSVSGTAGGQSFEVMDAVGLYNTTREYSGVFITDFTGSCTLLASGMTAPPSTQILEIELIANGIGMAPGPGTYAGTTKDVVILATYAASDANCKETVTEEATETSVTLATANATTVTGTFDVTFPNGDRLTGQFDAPVCNIDITNLGSNGGSCVGSDQ
jgi:hypothetical protein